MSSEIERARWAIASSFFFQGIFWGSWAPHIPLAKERLATTSGPFGAALLCMALGGIIAMPLAGHFIPRIGSARMTALGGIACCITLPLPAIASDLTLFAIALLLYGAALGSLDVALNAQGLLVERQLKRAVISGFHGLYSLAGLVAAGAASLVIGRVPELWHVLAASTVCLILLLSARPFMLLTDVGTTSTAGSFALPTRATLGLGLLCFLALMAEGSIMDWFGIYVRESLGSSTSVAALAFAFFSGGMAASRLAGDGFRLKFGAVRLVRWSAIATTASIALALSFDSPFSVIGCLVIAGLGIGNIAPILFAGGGRVEPLSPARGIAGVTTLGYLGFLAGPPMIGFAAEFTGLRLAIGLTAIAAAIIAIAASAVRPADHY